jgi:hypothetical protein
MDTEKVFADISYPFMKIKIENWDGLRGPIHGRRKPCKMHLV